VKTRRPILERGDRSTNECRTRKYRVFYWSKSRLAPKSRAAGEINSLHPSQLDVFTQPRWKAAVRGSDTCRGTQQICIGHRPAASLQSKIAPDSPVYRALTWASGAMGAASDGVLRTTGSKHRPQTTAVCFGPTCRLVCSIAARSQGPRRLRVTTRVLPQRELWREKPCNPLIPYTVDATSNRRVCAPDLTTGAVWRRRLRLKMSKPPAEIK